MAGKLNSQLNAKLSSAKQKTSDITENARVKARSAIDSSKSAAVKTVETSKQISNKAREKTGKTIDSSPLAMVAGGVAIGAFIAALLPKTQKEKEILGSASRKIGDTATMAIDAAKTAGAAHMVEVGLDSENLRKQAKDIFQKGYETAKSATKAAQDTIKKTD